MQRFHSCTFSAISAAILAIAAVSPSAAADNKPIDASATARVISAPIPGGVPAPDNSYAGLAETNVSVGIETTGVPCGECVPGVSGNNIGLPWPIFTVNPGQVMTVSTWFESTMYTGACTATFIMKQGSTVVAAGSYPFPGGCNAGYLYGVFFTVPVPATTGFTSVIGTVSGGTTNSGAVTFINVK